jgi:hypothetical protein
MYVNVSNARTNQSSVKDLKLAIENFEGDTTMQLDGTFDGLSKDVLDLFAFDAKKKPWQKWNMKGKTNCQFQVGFPLKENLSLEDMKINVSGKIDQLAAQINPTLALTDGALQITTPEVEGKTPHVAITGNVKLNGLQFTMRHHEFLKKRNEVMSETEVTAPLSLEQATKFGVAIPPALAFTIKGNVNTRTLYTRNSAYDEVKVTGDMSKPAVDVPFMAWKKPENEASEFVLAWRTKDETVTQSYAFSLSGQGILINAKGYVAKDFSRIRADLVPIRTPTDNSSLSFDYSKGGALAVHARGSKLNIEPFLKYIEQQKEDAKKRGEKSQPVYTSLQANMQVGRLRLLDGIVMDNVNLQAECDKDRCKQVVLNAIMPQMNNAPTSIRYAPDAANKGYMLNASIGNAGAFLRAFGYTRSIKNGVATITAKENAQGVGSGGLILKDFSVVRAPFFAKLLSIASFTGVLNLLQGDGVGFGKCDLRFRYTPVQFEIDHLRATSSALGITAKGQYHRQEERLALRGAIIPAYTLNNILGNIPLIGELIIGKEGEGVLATRYSMVGSVDDPEVSVNPLSMLTPGFLRNIWEGAEDSPAVTQ